MTQTSEPVKNLYKLAMTELLKPFPSTPIKGWKFFNETVGGFRPKEFTILCGSTGTGKTTLLANWSKCLLEANVKHFVMSVETGHTDYVKRVMSCYAEKDINTGEAIPVEAAKDFDALYGDRFKNDNLVLGLYENRVPIETLKKELIRHCEMGCKVAFIDNINFFMEVGNSDIKEMDRVIHELIILCKQIDMHVVMVMHPKKTDHGRVESEFDIKGSSTAVQEAHNVFLFNRLPQEMIDEAAFDGYSVYDRELKLQKMRRRGKHVGRKIILRTRGTCYLEKKLI